MILTKKSEIINGSDEDIRRANTGDSKVMTCKMEDAKVRRLEYQIHCRLPRVIEVNTSITLYSNGIVPAFAYYR